MSASYDRSTVPALEAACPFEATEGYVVARRNLLIGLWERAMIFLKRVGGIILALTILLWFLLSFPGAPADAIGPAIDYSFAGRIGHAMTAVFAPLGFNWQICIALIPGMAAREVVVSSLATVYALSASDDVAASAALTPIISDTWSLATALSGV